MNALNCVGLEDLPEDCGVAVSFDAGAGASKLKVSSRLACKVVGNSGSCSSSSPDARGSFAVCAAVGFCVLTAVWLVTLPPSCRTIFGGMPEYPELLS
jgi:hypothetical protein